MTIASYQIAAAEDNVRDDDGIVAAGGNTFVQNISFPRFVGWRFPSVIIPPDAVLLKAELTLVRNSVDGVSNWGTIYGVDLDDAPVWPTGSFPPYRPSTAPATSGSLPIVDGATQVYDVASAIEQIRARPGFSPGNAVAFVAAPASTSRMWWVSYPSVPADAAELTLEYITPGEALAAILAEMSVQPDALQKAYIRRLIADLMAAGVWDKLDLLYVMAAHHEQAARINWISPGDYTLTAVNAPTFTAEEGFNGDGSTSYLNTGWTPSTDAEKLTLNDGHISAWSLTERAGAAGMWLAGCSSATDALGVVNRNAGSNMRAHAHGNADIISIATAQGLFSGDRTGAATIEQYHNGASMGGTSSASPTALIPNDLLLCAVNAAGTPASFNTDQIAFATVGASLGDAGHAALYAALNSYLTKTPEIVLGRPGVPFWLDLPRGA